MVFLVSNHFLVSQLAGLQSHMAELMFILLRKLLMLFEASLWYSTEAWILNKEHFYIQMLLKPLL